MTGATEKPRARSLQDSRINRRGLRAGTRAPDFELPDLAGASRSLTEFLGTPTLLVFLDANCEPCDKLAPDLVALDHERPRRFAIVAVARGGREANRAKAAENGYTFPVLLQNGWQTSKQYGMFATPIAYLIDERGVIAEDVAIGPRAILRLGASTEQ